LVVNLAILREFGSYTRIYWKEKWKNDFAVIYDYKLADGPTCIVPIEALFETDYVKKKRNSYGRSKNWWSGTYPAHHELTKMVLKYQNRWDILK
jgi:hypothetical protein